MASRGRASGFTLIEAMVAMAVLVIGAVGLAAISRLGNHLNEDARVVVRATALAQDLLDQMQTWRYADDPRLVNRYTTNDADFTDSAYRNPDVVTPDRYDHNESELETQDAAYPWSGVPTRTAEQLGLVRYWNVAEVDLDGNGALNGKRVAAIVRWEQGSRVFREVVLVGFLRNPANTN